MNKSINVLKCISAFAVICIHCSLQSSGKLGMIIDALIRFAVPIFFLISGYYSYISDKNIVVEKYKKRTKRLLILIIISNLIYFIFDMFVENNYATIPKLLENKFNAKSIFSYIILNVSPTSGHLWFLNSLLYCYIIYLIMNKFDIKNNKLYKYVPILLIANIMIGEIGYYMKIYTASMYYRNFLFTGLPFFTLGYMIHDKQQIIKNKLSNKYIVVTIILSCMLIILERLATGKIELFIGTIFLSVFMFIWCILNPDKLKFKILGWIGEKLYTYIYILQGIVISLVRSYQQSKGLENSQVCYINTIIVFIGTVIIAMVIYGFFNIIRKIKKEKIYKEQNI